MIPPSTEVDNLNPKNPSSNIKKNKRENISEADIILEGFNNDKNDENVRKIKELEQENERLKIQNMIKEEVEKMNKNTLIVINNPQSQTQPPPQIVILDSKLKIPSPCLCFFIIINICMPGIGTIIAGIIYGNTTIEDRTGIVILHGIIQLLTFCIIIGWIWAIVDAFNSFERGCCG